MFRQYRLFTRFIRYRFYLPKRSNNIRKLIKTGQVQLLIGTQFFCAPKMDDNLDYPAKLEDDITRALKEGEAATIKLMTQLKDFVVVVSEEYRRCIKKQIEIIKKATYQQAGPYSEAYDDLPEYRSLSNELKKQLIDYYTLFNTLVDMASNENTLNLDNEYEDEEKMTEFQELQFIVEQQIKENSKCEKELLQAVTDSIVNEILFDISD